MIKAREHNKNYAFWLGLVLCTVYQSYRYPLQINTVGFSPTYSDTPLIWQAGKYVLAFPLIAVSAVRWLSNSARLTRWPIVLGTTYLSCYSFLKILGGHDSQYVDVFFWMLFSLILVLAVDTVSITAIDKYLWLLLAYAFASTLIEVFLFVAFGRLPAMAYPGTYLVRFGGFLDDPNGFAAILFLLMGWSRMRFKGRKRFLILAGLFISLLLTQSWTAIAFFLAMLLAYAVIAISKRPLFAIVAICTLPLLVILLVHWFQQLPVGVFNDLLEAKEGSIEGHIFPWAQWSSKWEEWALLGDWKYNAYESWWAAALVNFGVIWFGVYLGLITTLLIYLRRSCSKATFEVKPVYAGLLIFGYFFAFGSFGLPFPLKFPINAIFFVFLFLVAFGKIAPDDRATAPFHRQELAEARRKATCE
jgi:hypothetical protein